MTTKTTNIALRVFEERETKLEALRVALAEGKKSPFAEGYSLDRVLEKIERTPR